MAEEVARANWTLNYERGFLDIRNEHKNLGRFTTQNGWTTEGWNSIHRKFNEMFPLARFTKAHLQEKNKDLKATYKAIRDARKESGAGFNAATGVVTGGPNVLEKIEKYHKKASKFQRKGFLHYNSYEMLYEGSIATGDLSFTSIDPSTVVAPRTAAVAPSTTAVAPSTAVVAPSSASLGPSGGSSASLVHAGGSSSAVDAMDASSTSVGAVAAAARPDEATEVQSALAGTSTQQSGGKKRKQSQVAASLDSYLDHKKEEAQKTVQALLDDMKREDEYSVDKCLETTNAMVELTKEEKAIASEVFENDMSRQIFMKQKDHEV